MGAVGGGFGALRPVCTRTVRLRPVRVLPALRLAIFRRFCSDRPPQSKGACHARRYDPQRRPGRALRELREQHGLSDHDHDLAAATGITHEEMRALEAGKLDPTTNC